MQYAADYYKGRETVAAVYAGQWPTEAQERRFAMLQLTVPLDRDAQRAGVAAREWFQSSLDLLAGDVREVVLNSSEAELDWKKMTPNRTRAGVFLHVVRPTGLAEYEWPFSPRSFDRLLSGLVEHPAFASFETRINDEKGWPGPIPLEVVYRRLDDPWATLALMVEAERVEGESVEAHLVQRAVLDHVRRIADMCSPTHGGIYFTQWHDGTPLEEAMSVRGEYTIPRSREILRGYGWLTILAEGLGTRLGGLDALRASGAFAEVEHLEAGGFWLLATERLSDYREAAVDRVAEVLAPVLPVKHAEL